MSILLTVLLAESAARIFGLGRPVYQVRRFEPGSGVPFMQIPNGPLIYQPNVTFASIYDPAGDTRGYFPSDGRITYRINELGLRGPALPVEKPPDSFRIICLGDSFTFGEGVREEDTYAARLRECLAGVMPGRHIEVMNAGVQAYDAKDAAALYLMRCTSFRPDVVTLGFFLNDATDSAQTIRINEAMTAEYQLSFMAKVSRIWEVFERGRRARRIQRDYFETTHRSFQSTGWTDCKKVLHGMEQVSREDGFRFVVVLFPVLWELDGQYPFEDIHRLIKDACREAGCECIDLLDVYRGREAEYLWVHPTDHHPNEIAHRLAADRIAEYLTAESPQ